MRYFRVGTFDPGGCAVKDPCGGFGGRVGGRSGPFEEKSAAEVGRVLSIVGRVSIRVGDLNASGGEQLKKLFPDGGQELLGDGVGLSGGFCRLSP